MASYSSLKRKIKNCKKYENPASNVVKISVKDSGEIISPFAENEQAVISSNFAHFLENSVKDVSVKQDLTLEITSKKKCDDVSISSAIRGYYHNEFMETQRKLRRNLFAALSTFAIGILILFCSIYLAQSSPILLGLLNIFTWVFVWEAVHLVVFERAELHHQQHRQMNFINAKIIIK